MACDGIKPHVRGKPPAGGFATPGNILEIHL